MEKTFWPNCCSTARHLCSLKWTVFYCSFGHFAIDDYCSMIWRHSFYPCRRICGSRGQSDDSRTLTPSQDPLDAMIVFRRLHHSIEVAVPCTAAPNHGIYRRGSCASLRKMTTSSSSHRQHSQQAHLQTDGSSLGKGRCLYQHRLACCHAAVRL